MISPDITISNHRLRWAVDGMRFTAPLHIWHENCWPKHKTNRRKFYICADGPHTHNLSTHNLLTHSFNTHNLFTHNLSTHNLLTPNLSTHNLDTHSLFTHNLSTHTHTTYSHTTCSHTHNLSIHNLLTHSLSTHNLSTHNLLTNIVSLVGRRATWRHRHAFCVAGMALMALGWLWWRAWVLWSPRLFAWQAWHLATSTCILRGRRGTWRYRRAFCVAGVAL